MTSEILTQEDLAQITGYRTATAIERCLRKQGIRVLYGRRGVWTTLSAIEQALGLTLDQPKSPPPIEF